MNALILGGNGFIGSHLVDRLLIEGHAVRVFDRCDEKYRPQISGVEYIHSEFGNRRMVSEALAGTDVVFHLISTTIPKTSNDDPHYDVASNVLESLHLLDRCVEQRVRKLVFVSSGGTVYGRPQRLPVSEDSPTNPECSYGIVKLTIEKYLALYRSLHGLDYVIVRPSNPYGPRQNPFGEQGAIAAFLGRVASDEPITIWGDGRVIRDYLFVTDLVDGICRAGSSSSSSRILNLGAGYGRSLNDVVEALRAVVDADVQVTYTNGRSFDVPEVYLDIRKAQAELAWSPTTTLEDGIRQTWDFVNSTIRGDRPYEAPGPAAGSTRPRGIVPRVAATAGPPARQSE